MKKVEFNKLKFVFLETLYGAWSFEKLQEYVCNAEPLDPRKNMEELARNKGKHLVGVSHIESYQADVITIFFSKGYDPYTNLTYRKGSSCIVGSEIRCLTKLTWNVVENQRPEYRAVLDKFVPPEKVIPDEWITEESVWIEGPKN